MLSFSLFRIPVSIRGSFLLIATLLGFRLGDPVFIASWVALVFFSILIHELGHALVARSLGAEVEIELNGVGGLTRWNVRKDEFGPGRRALVAASGSAVGVAFGGLLWLVASQFGPYDRLAAFVIDRLIFVNLFWGLLNWLPIRPLDGGHLLISLLEKIAPDRAERLARVVFIATTAAALGVAIAFREPLIGLLSGWLLLAELVGSRRPAAPVPVPEFGYDDTEPGDGAGFEAEADH